MEITFPAVLSGNRTFRRTNHVVCSKKMTVLFAAGVCDYDRLECSFVPLAYRIHANDLEMQSYQGKFTKYRNTVIKKSMLNVDIKSL